MPSKTRKKVAIVGSGCAGLAAAWALKSTDYEIHLFEQSDRLGGHTNTQKWTTDGDSIEVDTGFIVMNTATYPNFTRFLKEVGVETEPTDMTFGVSRDHGKFEWSGEAQGVFAQRRNLFRVRHWRMIFDIVRFNQFALDMLCKDDEYSQSITIGQYLERERYSQAFRDDYLIPMTAAVWSTSPDKASLDFPAQTLIRFMWNHHLVSTLATRPAWLTLPGRSQRYIDAIVESLGEQLVVHRSARVYSIARPSTAQGGLVEVSWHSLADYGTKPHHRIQVRAPSSSDSFEHVVLACHGDQVLPMIDPDISAQSDKKSVMSTGSVKSNSSTTASASASQEEIEIFSAFQTTENICYLHSDLSLMPNRRKTWSSWNYLVTSKPSQLSHPAAVSLTYNMNILQHISERKYGHVLVTMNPDHEPDPEVTQGKYIYRHPLYTVEAVRAQERLQTIQNQRGVSYCGAWTKYGFHEDGFSSGLKVAIDHLGAELPFGFEDSTYSRGQRPVFYARDYALRVVISYMLIWLRLFELVSLVINSIVSMLGLPLVWAHIGLVGIFDGVFDQLERGGLME